MRRGWRWSVLVVVAAVAVGCVLLVRLADGDYSGDYRLTGYFPRAGEGLHPGSEVAFRGVAVGRVSSIGLAGTRARVVLLVDPTFRVPANATATIAPVNLFGAEQVTLTVPRSRGTVDPPPGPYLPPGGVLAHARTSGELGGLLAAAAPLLHRVDTTHLSEVVADLAQATDGEGPRIARAVDAGASLAGYLDQTLQAQLRALDSFSAFTAAVAPDGPAVNGLSAQENVALPAFNRQVAAYHRLLDNLQPFAAELARLLGDYHPDIVTLLSAGDNVARVLTAQQADVGQVIQGAYQYAFKVGSSGSAGTLPDGSRFVYFNTFLLFTDVNTLVCDLLAPPQAGLAFLEPVQQALAGAGTPLDCQSQFAAFGAAQGSPAPPSTAAPATGSVPAGAAGGGATAGGAAGSAGRAAQSLTTQVFGILGRPSAGAGAGGPGLGGYVGSLLGSPLLGGSP